MITVIARKTQNRIIATPAAAPANPPNPRAAATSATMKKINAHLNILFALLFLYPREEALFARHFFRPESIK
jgi:hypothetical protein